MKANPIRNNRILLVQDRQSRFWAIRCHHELQNENGVSLVEIQSQVRFSIFRPYKLTEQFLCNYLVEEDSDDDERNNHCLSPSSGIFHLLMIKTNIFVFIAVAKLMKHMDLHFESIRKENDDKFSLLSKKMERRWHPDVVRIWFIMSRILFSNALYV